MSKPSACNCCIASACAGTQSVRYSYLVSYPELTQSYQVRGHLLVNIGTITMAPKAADVHPLQHFPQVNEAVNILTARSGFRNALTAVNLPNAAGNQLQEQPLGLKNSSQQFRIEHIGKCFIQLVLLVCIYIAALTCLTCFGYFGKLMEIPTSQFVF